jgi:hypothetical protein
MDSSAEKDTLIIDGLSEHQASAHPLKILLSVYRRLDNRSEGLPDDSPRGLELHNRRKEALHEALVGEGWEVQDWGVTDGARTMS